jgi:hypothetical protein
MEHLGNLEKFIHSPHPMMPVLVKAALASSDSSHENERMNRYIGREKIPENGDYRAPTSAR